MCALPAALPPLLFQILTVGADIRDKFRDYMTEYSPVERAFYAYLTSVVVRPSSRAPLTP